MANSKFGKVVLAGFVAIILAVVMTGCGSKANNNVESPPAATNSSSGKGTVVNIAVNPTLTPLLIAKEKGLVEEAFAKVGATVEWKTFKSGPEVLEAISGGHVDLGTIAPLPPVTALANGVDLKLVATFAVFSKGNAIIVNKDSAIQTIADLKGKKIATTKGTMGNDLLLTALRKADLKETDVQIIQFTPDEAKAAFDSSNVDAWAIWDPNITIEVATRGARIITDGDQLDLHTPNYIMVNGKFSKDHADLLKIYLKTIKEATDWEKANLEEAIDVFAKAKGLDRNIVTEVVKRDPIVFEPISDTFIELEKSIAKQLFDEGKIKTQVDPSTIIDNSFINEVLSESK
jgi:sulfonate transport system substrate-binding protein